ncbi:unnamed protein product [Effrenium voratum]|uniref:Serine hydrolase domain-containing protein n=1 Tax=Effrenium voratum TaxID=2562239 RepID=A0AA36HMP1_9DINO|nr:unnamed protein product [Effrenium voratum]CAJ1462038.1 unnamed protein product [Effrenium voratum]
MSFWEVVGGGEKGGILVREGQALKSPELSERLATGSVVGELERQGERLRYCLLRGEGPVEGWVSLKVAGKDLIQPCSDPAGPAPSYPELGALEPCVPMSKDFPLPKGQCFGKDGKMKMLYLHGGGVSKTVAQMQLNSTFKDLPNKKQLDWTIWTGPHEVPLGWNGDYSLKPFGPNFSVYFERLPFANCQWETWEGLDHSIKEFKSFLKANGPFDGAMGFDMGGELLVHAANLATEGDVELQKAFRFLILFTSTAPKHLSPLGAQRIKAPLRIPTICSWATSDENHPYMEYEELPLFIHRDFREVVVHGDGHKPAVLKKDQSTLWRFARFLYAMERGNDFIPTDHPDNLLRRRLWLPIQRPASKPSAAKQLLVVPNVSGHGEVEDIIQALKASEAKGEPLEMEGEAFVRSGSPPKPLQRLNLLMELYGADQELFKGAPLEVKQVSFPEAQSMQWHDSQVPSRQLISKDLILEDMGPKAQQLAAQMSEPCEEGCALVGFGAGAFLAFAMVRELVSQKRKPQSLCLVNPPLQVPWSMVEPCCLEDVSVHVLMDRDSTYGPPWRYEVATKGNFTTELYEDLPDMAAKVLAKLG